MKKHYNNDVEKINDYIKNNTLNDKWLVNLASKAIILSSFKKDEIDTLTSIKKITIERDLLDATISQIIKRKNPYLFAKTALIFDNSLIKRIYGSKEKLYMYIEFNDKLTDEEKITLKNYLLTMNQSEYTKQINQSNQKIDEQILTIKKHKKPFKMLTK